MSPNKYKGAALQPFFMFFLIKDPYQIKSAFLMEECITHSIKKKSINQLPQDDFPSSEGGCDQSFLLLLCTYIIYSTSSIPTFLSG